MKIHLGADHRGFELKNQLKTWLENQGHQVTDHGADSLDPHDDYPPIAWSVAQAVSQDPEARGVVACGSGIGVAITANKQPGIRAAVGHQTQEVTQARRDDNINVLALAADTASPETAQKLVTAFLETDMASEARYQRRLDQITEYESLSRRSD